MSIKSQPRSRTRRTHSCVRCCDTLLALILFFIVIHEVLSRPNTPVRVIADETNPLASDRDTFIIDDGETIERIKSASDDTAQKRHDFNEDIQLDDAYIDDVDLSHNEITSNVQRRRIARQKQGEKCRSDTIFLIDSSGSVEDIFSDQLEYVQHIVDSLNVSSNGDRVAVMLFSGRSRNKIRHSLTDRQDKDLVQGKISSLPHIGGVTMAGAALDHAYSELENRRNDSDTVVNVVVISDAFSLDTVAEQSAAIRRIPGARIFAVAITRGVKNEMMLMAGTDDNIFEGFDSYGDLAMRLQECSGTKSPSKVSDKLPESNQDIKKVSAGKSDTKSSGKENQKDKNGGSDTSNQNGNKEKGKPNGKTGPNEKNSSNRKTNGKNGPEEKKNRKTEKIDNSRKDKTDASGKASNKVPSSTSSSNENEKNKVSTSSLTEKKGESGEKKSGSIAKEKETSKAGTEGEDSQESEPPTGANKSSPKANSISEDIESTTIAPPSNTATFPPTTIAPPSTIAGQKSSELTSSSDKTSNGPTIDSSSLSNSVITGTPSRETEKNSITSRPIITRRRPLDVIVLLDSSGSVRERFEAQLAMIGRLLDALPVKPVPAHVGVVKFGGINRTRVLVPLNNPLTNSEIKNQLLTRLQFLGGVTYAKEALTKTVAELNSSGDKNAIQTVILFSDGFIQDEVDDEIKALQRTGAKIFAAAITKDTVINRRLLTVLFPTAFLTALEIACLGNNRRCRKYLHRGQLR